MYTCWVPLCPNSSSTHWTFCAAKIVLQRASIKCEIHIVDASYSFCWFFRLQCQHLPQFKPLVCSHCNVHAVSMRRNTCKYFRNRPKSISPTIWSDISIISVHLLQSSAKRLVLYAIQTLTILLTFTLIWLCQGIYRWWAPSCWHGSSSVVPTFNWPICGKIVKVSECKQMQANVSK